MEDKPVMQSTCDSHRENCQKIRTLEIQNMLLTLRAEFRAELEALGKRVEGRFAEALAAAGYEDLTPADTAVPADPRHHPERREKDLTWRQRALNYLFKNLTVILIALLCLVVGSKIEPYVTRLIEAALKAIGA